MADRLGRVIDHDLPEVLRGAQRAGGQQPRLKEMGEVTERIQRAPSPSTVSAGSGTPLRLAICSSVLARTVPSR